jgi:hypothetical protein
MHRVAYLVLGSCLLAALGVFASPLKAGEYVWYSAGCCDRQVVRHERYVPARRDTRPYLYEGSPRVHAPQPGRHCVVQQSAFNYAHYPTGPHC